MFKIGQTVKVNLANLEKGLATDANFKKHLNGVVIQRIDMANQKAFFSPRTCDYFYFKEILPVKKYKVIL